MQNCNENQQICNENCKFESQTEDKSMFVTSVHYRRSMNRFTSKTKYIINPFYKIMKNNKFMIEGISGLGRDIFDDFAIETTEQPFTASKRFIISLNPESYKRFANKYAVSTETIKRTYKELIDRGLFIKYDNGTKYDYIFNFMPAYAGTDEEFAKDVDDYGIKDLYEPYYHKLIAYLDEKHRKYKLKEK